MMNNKDDKKSYEVTELREWIGEIWCIVCDKDVDKHSLDELFDCRKAVLKGYRLT